VSAGATGTLHLVPTPLGNDGDITLRALEVLRAVDIVAAEDTRHALRLFRAHGIDKPLHSYFDHNEERRAPWLIDKLREGRSVALISDAGTPLINDPGFRIVQLALEAGIALDVLPGPCAAVTALVASGLPTDAFLFAGFLPRAEGQRDKKLRTLQPVAATLVFYEAPHRLVEMLTTAAAVLGARKAAVAINLTKDREEVLRGTLPELVATLSARERVGGEATVVIAGSDGSARDLPRAEAHARALLAAGLPPRRVRDLVVVADAFELPRRGAYEIVLALAGTAPGGDAEDGDAADGDGDGEDGDGEDGDGR
jgi:16S rRNA (cytidine1402-2'-O)-methyltransferase